MDVESSTKDRVVRHGVLESSSKENLVRQRADVESSSKDRVVGKRLD